EELRHMGILGGAYVLARTGGKVLGCRLGERWAGESLRNGERIGTALLCQAAVVIGLCAFVGQRWESPLARTFTTVILGSVVVFELIGPVLLKRCVVTAGEVKAITLLRRGNRGDGSASTPWLAQVLSRFARSLRFGRRGGTQPLRVRHIMRTNVPLLPASAPFDEVLHFIERSTHSHFTVVGEDGEYAGVIHFADVRDVLYDPVLRELVTAADLADPDSPTVRADMPIRDLFDVFTRTDLTLLPVVDDTEHRRIVGMVEQRDVLRALHRTNAASETRST
ncbi:MAG: CBS domain-containing protein, partial [Planctomycetota bacterium]